MYNIETILRSMEKIDHFSFVITITKTPQLCTELWLPIDFSPPIEHQMIVCVIYNFIVRKPQTFYAIKNGAEWWYQQGFQVKTKDSVMKIPATTEFLPWRKSETPSLKHFLWSRRALRTKRKLTLVRDIEYRPFKAIFIKSDVNSFRKPHLLNCSFSFWIIPQLSGVSLFTWGASLKSK